MHLVLVIDIHGDVDQSGLERLRTHLDLKKQGRLSDDWDQEFGYRKIAVASGQVAKVGLFRNFDGSWTIQVIASDDVGLGTNELTLLKSQLIDGVMAAGYEFAVRPQPTFGSAEE